ncbi:hypothetical protein PG984_002990 [Apiospora sp. TS-2023a]
MSVLRTKDPAQMDDFATVEFVKAEAADARAAKVQQKWASAKIAKKWAGKVVDDDKKDDEDDKKKKPVVSSRRPPPPPPPPSMAVAGARAALARLRRGG